MRIKKDGLNLSEEIELALEKCKENGSVDLIHDAFLEPELDNSYLYYVRRTNLLREGSRTRNIEDEVLVAQKLQAQFEVSESERDRTFYEFKSQYEDYIEGRATQQRAGR